MRYHKIANETIRRLPIYLRGMFFLSEQNRKTISSQNLADIVGINPWQIRKDFSYFGDFGKPGVGYIVEKLIRHIKKILNLDKEHKTALIGVGNLGRAILAYPGFKPYGFNIIAAFDNDPAKIGTIIEDIKIEDVSALRTLSARSIDLAIIAVPRDAAQEIADVLAEAGVKGILKFSPHHIEVPKKTKVISIDIATDLARLPYYMSA